MLLGLRLSRNVPLHLRYGTGRRDALFYLVAGFSLLARRFA
jgi:hypothetical protein